VDAPVIEIYGARGRRHGNSTPNRGGPCTACLAPGSTVDGGALYFSEHLPEPVAVQI